MIKLFLIDSFQGIMAYFKEKKMGASPLLGS
jgi:hypothetical protein